MSVKVLGGFNTSLQEVDERYEWINGMIESRQNLVTDFMKLINLKQIDFTDAEEGHEQNAKQEVIRFCEKLIDYISHGHFDIYPKIVELIEKASPRSLSIVNRVLPRIEKTTEFLLLFNDRYAENLTDKKMATLHKDLESVANCLELRFRSEDRLIIGLGLVSGHARLKQSQDKKE